MNENTPPQTSAKAVAEALEPRHLSEVLTLQNAVRAALPDDQKQFVLPQPDSYFENLLARRNGSMVGLRKNGELVAQIVLMGPMPLEQAIDRNVITRSDVTFHHAASSESVVIAKSMAVHPTYQRNGLAQQLLQAVLAQPVARLADHVFAQISVENTRSWELFLRNGFGVVAAALDPQDGHPRFVLQKPALGFALHEMASMPDADPIQDFSSIMRMTQGDAYVGRFDIEGSLAFNAPAEAATSWYDKPAVAGNDV